MTVKEFKRKISTDNPVKLIDGNGRFVGHAEHRTDWDEAEVQEWRVIKRERFPDFYVVTV